MVIILEWILKRLDGLGRLGIESDSLDLRGCGWRLPCREGHEARPLLLAGLLDCCELPTADPQHARLSDVREARLGADTPLDCLKVHVAHVHTQSLLVGAR